MEQCCFPFVVSDDIDDVRRIPSVLNKKQQSVIVSNFFACADIVCRSDVRPAPDAAVPPLQMTSGFRRVDCLALALS